MKLFLFDIVAKGWINIQNTDTMIQCINQCYTKSKPKILKNGRR